MYFSIVNVEEKKMKMKKKKKKLGYANLSKLFLALKVTWWVCIKQTLQQKVSLHTK